MSNLKDARIKAGKSQTQLSKESGVNFRMIQHYEQGVKDVDGARLETLCKLSRALNCGISDILNNSEIVNGCKI